MLNRSTALIFVPCMLMLAACSDPVDPPRPVSAAAVTPLEQNVRVGTAVPAPPSIRVTTSGGRPLAGVHVTFTVQSGGGTISGADQVTDNAGVARAASWTLGTGPGLNSVRASVDGLPDVQIVFEAIALPDDCPRLVTLDLPLGGFTRLKGADATTYPCLLFDSDESAGSEYILLFENMSPSGTFAGALFAGPRSDTSLGYSVSVLPLEQSAGRSVDHLRLSSARRETDRGAPYAWDFGAGRIREHTPDTRDIETAAPRLLRGGRAVDMNSAEEPPAPGDTILVLLEGIPRLDINTGIQRAVIRHVSDDLVIAEDIRLATMPRASGGFNTPISEADLAAIAAEYSAVARVQGDIFFEGRHNSAVEARTPQRVTAVHSLMPGDDVWGYTYSVTSYFVWDYWVATNGVTKGLNQHPQRITDNLFMHEIAHMRHFGMLQHNDVGIARRGNRWLVEGFARFTERMPIAARLLGTTSPSRTGNALLPRNPAFNNAYFLDDVPTYLNAGSSVYFGYQTSSYVFDYFADQVAVTGGDWLPATREFLLAGGSRNDLDEVVGRWLPGTTFADLFTRARIALYTDDIGTDGLPAWTQYHQYRLRESRPAPGQAAGQDPRVLWPRISPGTPLLATGDVAAGAAAGFLIDGNDAPSALIRVTGPDGPHAGLSIARIR